MIRKLLMVAAAAAVPMGAIAAGAVGAGVAGAKTVIPLTPASCAISGTVTFAAPGISLPGLPTSNKTSSTGTTLSFSGCSPAGASITGGGALSITTKNSKCTGTNAPIPGCAKGKDIYDSGGGLGSASTFKSLDKAVKGLPIGLTETSGSVVIKSKALTPSEVIGSGTSPGPCVNPGGGSAAADDEVGFSIPTTVKTSPKSTGVTAGTILVCLGADSGVSGGTPSKYNGNFYNDLLTAGATIASVAIDPVTSSISLH
jgi:hypothetical protein